MDCALVGMALPGVTNASLSVLEGACAEAGLSARRVPFTGFADLLPAVAEVRSLRPRVVGISIQSTEGALAALTFASVLRRDGFTGTLVCGGHFATLHAQDILEACPAMDYVVRLAGEVALVGLLRGDAPATLPGVVWRNEAGGAVVGAPARATSLAPSQVLVQDHLGVPAADVIASEGCEHTCAYCCVAVTSRLARHEAQRDGRAWSPERRSPRGLAEHLAELYRKHGARVFNLMDDNLLPDGPEAAAAFATTLRSELDALGVPAIACSLQLRADAVDERSASALAALGLARAYVGVDGYSAPGLHALGRRSPATAGPRAVRLLAERGVFPTCNALLLGPTTTETQLRAELDAIAEVHHAPVHLLPIDVREGTPYLARARRAGLVEGGFLWRHYRFADPVAARVARVLLAMPTRLAERSVPLALYDYGYNLGIAARLHASVSIEDLSEDYFRVARLWNADQLRLLGIALEEPDAERVIGAESERVRAHDEALLGQVDGALRELERRVRAASGRNLRAHERGRLICQLAASFTMLAACASPPAPVDAGLDAATDAIVDAAVDGASDVDADAEVCEPTCEDPMLCAADPPGSLECGLGCEASFLVDFDDAGVATEVRIADGMAIDATIRACVLELLATACYPSLAGTTHTIAGHCWIA